MSARANRLAVRKYSDTKQIEIYYERGFVYVRNYVYASE